MLNNLLQMHLKLLQKERFIKQQKQLVIVDKNTRVLKTSPKNNSETNKEEILRERFIPSELRHKIIDDLRLREENY